MSQLNVTTLKHESAGVDNLVLDSSGNATFGGVAKVGGLMNPSGSASAIAMDSAGRVTMPYQPVWAGYNSSHDYGSGTSSSSLYTGATTTINVGGHWNGTRFTCPVSGVYLVHVHYMKNNNASLSGHFDVYKNGSMITSGRVRASEGATYAYPSGDFYVVCNANDYIEFFYYGTAGIHTEHSNFSIRLVG